MIAFSRTFVNVLVLLHLGSATIAQPIVSERAILAEALSKVVKIHGAGGPRGLEAYQSGILVSADGQVLTAASHVLSGSEIRVTLDDGRTAVARLVAQDLTRDLALLQFDGAALPHFTLGDAPPAVIGTPIVALSNLFDIASGDEPVSVQAGYVSARTRLAARQGKFATAFQGEVLILDCVTNNPGAAGGALIDRAGKLLGLIGKELTSDITGVYVSYALPSAEVKAALESLRAGGPALVAPSETKVRTAHNLESLGVILVPDVLLKTPPFVDAVREGSPAASAGLQADDLIVELGGDRVTHCREALDRLRRIDRIDPVRLRLLRDGVLLDVELRADPP